MRKNVFGRRLKRDRNERKSLFKGLMSSLILHGRIQTTEEKAKAIKGSIEKLVTKARKGAVVGNLMQEFLTPEGVKKMIGVIGPHFAKRPGGYTRILKLGQRFNDNAHMVILEWVEQPIETVVAKVEKVTKKVVKEETPLRSSSSAGQAKVVAKKEVKIKKEKK